MLSEQTRIYNFRFVFYNIKQLKTKPTVTLFKKLLKFVKNLNQKRY
jgi:hypothetical protein